MNRRNFLASSVAALAAVPFVHAKPKKQPNILFMFSDDHGWQTVSAYGSGINKTPHIDRLATEGMRFDRCYVTNSICAPSRATILTGKHSHLNGQLTNRNTFDGSQQTFPKLLQKQGYKTAMVGKWHLKSDPTGFDYFDVLIGQGPYYNPPMKTNASGEVETVKHEGYTTDIITDKAIDWLKKERDPDKPFMLMYQHKAPHRNWQPALRHLNLFDDVEIKEPPTLFDDYSGRTSASKEQAMTIERHMNATDLKLAAPGNLTPAQKAIWDAAYDPKNEAFKKANLQGKDLVRWKFQRYAKDYLRCVHAVDESVGKVLDYLDESGLAEDTIVIYNSDQGWYLGEHGWFDKRWMYEESYRAPFLVRWPGVTKPGSINDDLVQNLDFASTFVDVAGGPIPADLQGVSLVPLLKGETPPEWRESLYYHYYEFPGAHSVKKHEGVSTKEYKLMHFYEQGESELYDLTKDPDELNSVFGDPAYADIQARLESELKKLKAQYRTHDMKAQPPEIKPTKPHKKKQKETA